MIFTNEQLAKARAAKNAEELLALAKAEGVALTEDEAAKYFAEFHKEGELSDDELDNVSGGCGGSNESIEEQQTNNAPPSKYHLGDTVWNITYKRWGTIYAMEWDDSNCVWLYKTETNTSFGSYDDLLTEGEMSGSAR